MDRAEAHPEALEAGRRQLDSLRVAVNADDGEVLEAFERTFGVATHAQGSIDEDAAGTLDRGGEHVEALAQQHGHVTLARRARRIAHRLRCIAHIAPPLRS